MEAFVAGEAVGVVDAVWGVEDAVVFVQVHALGAAHARLGVEFCAALARCTLEQS